MLPIRNYISIQYISVNFFLMKKQVFVLSVTVIQQTGSRKRVIHKLYLPPRLQTLLCSEKVLLSVFKNYEQLYIF